MDKKQNKTRVAQKKSSGNKSRQTSSSSGPRKKTTKTQNRKAINHSTTHLSYQKSGKRKQKKRRKMSKTERYIHIAIRWIIFFAIVILLLFFIGKGISAAFHVLTGNSKPKAVQEVSTEDVEEKPSPKSKKTKKNTKPIEITISAVGDTTLGTDESFGYEGSFTQVYDSVQDFEYFLSNTKSIFEADDLTIANLEGTLTRSVDMQGVQNSFSGKPEYAKILSLGSVEAVDLANDHTMDYGEDGYKDTIEYLAQTGVKSFGTDKNLIMEVKGVQVGLLGVNATGNDLEAYKEKVLRGMTDLEKRGAQLIIASFHWGIEKNNYPTEMQQTLAHLAIDSGADLVLGHNPHVLQGIEEYNGKNIVYSLGNFCYGANANPSDMDTMIYQQTFTVTGDKVKDDLVTNVIPCRVSSIDTGNNYQPTPVEGEAKDMILSKVEEYSLEIIKMQTESTTEVTQEVSETTDTDVSQEKTFE